MGKETTEESLLGMIPIASTLTEPFSTTNVADALSIPRGLAQKMAYCLREMGAIETTGKKGNARMYRKTAPVDPVPQRRHR